MLMPPKQTTKLSPSSIDAVAKVADPMVDHLDDDIVATIFGCLGLQDAIRMRLVCTKWREAAKKTLVPMMDFCVHNYVTYRAMSIMTTALPNLQQLSIYNPGWEFTYSDGEDPVRTRLNINVISNFTKLRSLTIEPLVSLDGRYPCLFNFPLLERLDMTRVLYMKWELGMLSGFPSLKELHVRCSPFLRGSVGTLRALKNTLEQVTITDCDNIRGNFMDLADFPRLTHLNLKSTAVTGDVREISGNDFLRLRRIILPKTVVGGWGYHFQSISEVPSVVNALYQCVKRDLDRTLFNGWCGYLSRESPDWYDGYHDYNCPDHPFTINIVQIGPRVGWRWTNEERDSCEINWLDPEPVNTSYSYIEELQCIKKEIDFYKGYYEPPTELEYNRLCEDYDESL